MTKEEAYKKYPFLKRLDDTELIVLITSFMLAIITKDLDDSVVGAVKDILTDEFNLDKKKLEEQ